MFLEIATSKLWAGRSCEYGPWPEVWAAAVSEDQHPHANDLSGTRFDLCVVLDAGTGSLRRSGVKRRTTVGCRQEQPCCRDPSFSRLRDIDTCPSRSTMRDPSDISEILHVEYSGAIPMTAPSEKVSSQGPHQFALRVRSSHLPNSQASRKDAFMDHV